MKIRVPYYYNSFKCTASECKDTCCTGWEIIIDNDTFNKYKKVKNSFSKRLNSEITFYEDNEPGFKLKNNNCAFLNENLLCDIYSNLGEDYLCHTCKTFPRIIDEYGSLREITLSLSCPEAAKLILKDSKKLSFDVHENDEFVTGYNSISADLYIQILGARQIAFKIIQNDLFNLNVRLAILLKFAAEIQEKIDACELSQISKIRKKYSDIHFIEKCAKDLKKYENNKEKRYKLIHEYFNIFNNLEQINESWATTMENAISYFYDNNDYASYIDIHNKFNNYYKDKDYEYENLNTYFIFRYFLKSLYDADLLSKVKLGIMSYIMIKELNVFKFEKNHYKFDLDDQIDISHMYSRDIEHSDNNIEKLYNIFNNNEFFNTENFITILKN